MSNINKKVSLDQISNPSEVIDLTAGKVEEKVITPTQGTDTLEVFDISSLPKKAKETNTLEDSLFSELDEAVDRECESITERIEAVVSKQQEELEQNMEKSDDIEDDDISDDDIRIDDDEDIDGFSEEEDTTTSILKDEDTDFNNIHKTDDDFMKELGIDAFDDEDIDEEDSSDESTDTDNMLEILKKEAKEKIIVNKTKLDLNSFTISKKAVNPQTAMKVYNHNKRSSMADWVALSEERAISMSALSGPEIIKLNPENSSRNRLNTFRDMYKVIYDHVIDGNKPDFESWLKKTRFADMPHIYFALYMATFTGSNFVNYVCPKCNKPFLKDVKFEDMVVYASDEIKEKVKNILRMDTNSDNSEEYPVDLVQISDSYVFGLRTPSIWNVIIETASLSDKFLEKYSDLIDILAYIDGVYVIDRENNSLVPINTNPDKNNQAKSSARRIKVFYDIISNLSSEEYYELRSRISTYDENSSKIEYQIPACSCPDCAVEIPANKEIGPDGLLFIRHQLAAIGNM